MVRGDISVDADGSEETASAELKTPAPSTGGRKDRGGKSPSPSVTPSSAERKAVKRVAHLAAELEVRTEKIDNRRKILAILDLCRSPSFVLDLVFMRPHGKMQWFPSSRQSMASRYLKKKTAHTPTYTQICMIIRKAHLI